MRYGVTAAGLATALMVFPVSPAGSSPLSIGGAAIRDSVARYAALGPGQASTVVVYNLLRDVEARRIRLESPEDADTLSAFLAGCLDPGGEPILRHRVVEFFSFYPHPAAADGLWRLVELKDRSVMQTGDAPVRILADLQDRRIVPLLFERVRTNSGPSEPYFLAIGNDADIKRLDAMSRDDELDAEARSRAAATATALRARTGSALVDNFGLDAETLATIAEHGFAVGPTTENEMFELYGPEYPFVTSDVIWHTWMIMVRAGRNEMERLVLLPKTRELVVGLLEESRRQADRTRDGAVARAAIANAETWAVAALLLGVPESAIQALPDTSRAQVRAELAMIIAEAGIRSSGVTNRDLDTSRYRDVGASDRQGWHQAMTFLGRTAFRAGRPHEVQQALLLAGALQDNPGLWQRWREIDAILEGLFGPHDDLTPADVIEAARSTAGPSADGAGALERLAGDGGAVASLAASLEARPGPAIATDPRDGSRGRARGVRLLGQRYSRPIAFLQAAIDRGVWPPAGAELVKAIRSGGVGLAPPPGDRFTSLSEGFLECSRILLQPPSTGAPEFMRKPRWRDKQTNAVLGSWAELQELTAAYVKDANTYQSVSKQTDTVHGYVEPVPVWYASLDSLNRRIVSRFDAMGLWTAIEADMARADSVAMDPSDYHSIRRQKENRTRPSRADFERFSDILGHLERLARKELNSEPQSIDDGFFLKALYRDLMWLSFNRSHTNTAPVPMSVIATVASEYQSGTCLQVATGRPWVIYAAVTDRNRRIVCRGAVYSYYEFISPIGRQFNVESWRATPMPQKPGDPVPWFSTRAGRSPEIDPTRGK